jgi:hypothetical protein
MRPRPTGFSLVLGGLLFQLYRRTQLLVMLLTCYAAESWPPHSLRSREPPQWSF